MIKDCILGIDIGTTGAKCTCYQYDGRIAATAYQEYPTICPEPGWEEQNPLIWWNAVKDNLVQCFVEQKFDAQRISVIGLSCTNAMTLVDSHGNPLYNAINHHDTRATQQVVWLQERIGEERFLESTRNRLDKGTFALPTVRWLVDNKPGILDSCEKMLMPSGFIIYKLTGEFSINDSRADLTSMSNMEIGRWDEELCDRAEIPKRILPRMYRSTDIVGMVSRSAAEETGLCAGTPVTAGAVDTVAATIGSGAVLCQDAAITLGSCARLCIVSDKAVSDKRLLNIRSAVPHTIIQVQSTDNAGVSLKWFRDKFGRAIVPMTGQSVYQAMDELAEASGPGARNMVFLPYLGGEKSPIWDSQARGVFFNITTDSDYGCFVRAILEGVAFSIRDCFTLMSSRFESNEPIPMGGGAAKSRLWCQIFSDILNRPIIQLLSNETETLGAMIIAAQAIGLSEVPFDFGKTLAKRGTVLYPNRELVGRYDEQFEIYKNLYTQMKPIFHDTSVGVHIK